jgi:hypothetical protein
MKKLDQDSNEIINSTDVPNKSLLLLCFKNDKQYKKIIDEAGNHSD